MNELFAEVDQGDSLQVLSGLPEGIFDSCVTDPPYGLSFMGKAWDYDVPQTELWRQVYRTLKPGAFLLAFFGTRTYHRGVVQIEDAGFEIRDQLGWMYGSGFPKSMDVSKAIDNAAGITDRPIVGMKLGGERLQRSTDENGDRDNGESWGREVKRDAFIRGPVSAAAAQWQGWGTALKPAWEPIVLARKPLIGTVAENVVKHGTGGLNIDGCRVPAEPVPINRLEKWSGFGQEKQPDYVQEINNKGRFPANVIHDGSEEVVALFPTTKSGKPGVKRGGNDGPAYGAESRPPCTQMGGFGDEGSAARFFYCPKAAKSERGKDNNHPTVKPVELMKYLCRLVTPPGGVVLDPFCGSGTTGIAAKAEGFNFAGIELDPAFAELARKRIEEWTE